MDRKVKRSSMFVAAMVAAFLACGIRASIDSGFGLAFWQLGSASPAEQSEFAGAFMSNLCMAALIVVIPAIVGLFMGERLK